MGDNLTKVGRYGGEYDILLGITLPQYDIYISAGLETHIRSRHQNCLPYLANIKDIIEHPDYVGKNPSEPDSIELVKVYSDNIQIGIKLDLSHGYLYVATLFDIKQGKINRRLHSGRLKPIPAAEDTEINFQKCSTVKWLF